MALNNFKVEIKRLDEGQWFKIDGMDFLIRGINKSLSGKLQKCFSKKKVSDKLYSMNELVANELIADWSGVTKLKLQSVVTGPETHKESEWYSIGDINFLLKRQTPDDDQQVTDCTTPDAKQRRKIQLMILDWENLKFNDDDKECVPFSKKTALEIFMNEEYREVFKPLQEFSSNPENFLETVDDKEIKFNKDNIKKYMVDVDRNDLVNKIVECSSDTKSYQEELIEKDVDLAKK